MRVVVLTHTFFPIVGGAEVGIHEIYRRFVGDDVIVLTPIAADHADEFSVESQPALRYKVVRYERWTRWLGSRFLGRVARRSGWQEFQLIRALHRERAIDAVNIHFVRPLGLATLWIRLFLRLPVTISLVGRTDVWKEMTAGAKLLTALVVRSSTSCTENSRYYLEGSRLSRKATLVPYGVNTSKYSPAARAPDVRALLGVQEGQTMLLAVQRLSPLKRVDVLLEVAHRLESLAPEEFHLVVVGKGSGMAVLETKVKELGLANVSIAGFVAESGLPAMYASADVFVSHSLSETFGVVFAEAMACGLPIVAAKASCIPMVVSDGENGLLVEPFDVEGFARRLLELRRDRALAAAISARNVAKARTEFDWDKIAEHYRRILGRTRSARSVV